MSKVIVLPVSGCEVCEQHIAWGVNQACIDCYLDEMEDHVHELLRPL